MDVKLAINADPDKYIYTGYGIGLNSRSEFSLTDGNICKNVIIFGVDMSSSVHIHKKKKDILILGIGPTQRLDDTTLTAESQYSINFSRSNRKFLCLHYNGSNRFLFVNATKICQFKAKDPEIEIHPLCLGNISGDSSADKMKKKRGLNGCVYDFSVDYKTFNTSDIVNIQIFNEIT